ncbi:precorrin-6A reductase [uncultured Ruminococcus sp.]|uniref:precorrin-6A reductase n=1 Tax=uncultured Ruminococcus sp. TaxID=165186 RepID=UPI002608D4B8|nr:precorrin-6A reductase [uncultured Ruminococcus sp.]
MKRIAVIAGTSEATEFIRALPEKYEVTAFTATEYGRTILAGERCTVHVGRLDKDGFAVELARMDAVVDASHPFALAVTETVQQVCTQQNIPYFRLGRPQLHYDYDWIIRVPSKEAAAEQLSEIPGNILLTTGVNTLAFYEANVTDFAARGWARILDTADSRRTAAASRAHLVYAMPPFSQKDTIFLIKTYQIAVLVSKDSGARGGVAEKIAAAKACGIPVILIGAPKEDVHTIAEVIFQLDHLERSDSKCWVHI